MLLGAAACWGSGFIAQRVGAESLGPLLFNAVRYAIGAALVLPLVGLSRRGLQRESPSPWSVRLVRDAVLLGVVLAGAAVLQQAGMKTSTSARAGFITGLYVLIVPAMAWWSGQRPTVGNFLGVLLAFAGMWLFSGDLAGAAAGDWLVLASVPGWALHVVLIGLMANRHHATALVGLQFLVAAVISGTGALLLEPVASADFSGAWLAVAYSGVLATAVAFLLQFIAQREAPPTHATVLMSTESLFAALCGWLLLGEHLGPRELLGGGLMLAGALVSQLVGVRRQAVAAPGAAPVP